jgi:hypothetical protein
MGFKAGYNCARVHIWLSNGRKKQFGSNRNIFFLLRGGDALKCTATKLEEKKRDNANKRRKTGI